MEPQSGLLEVRRQGALVTLTGEVDLNTSDLLRAELTLARASGDDDVVVDFAGLTFIGSSGLHVLIETATALGEAPGAAGRRLGCLRREPARAEREVPQHRRRPLRSTSDRC